MKFTKMHGLGNDYVYVNAFAEELPHDLPGLARAVSDRHTGIGGDGLILICPSERADARMRMFNADGSESEMCGNGVRCVAKYVYDHGIAQQPELRIETGRGVLTLHLQVRAGRVESVRVDMGEPILDAELIPTTLPGPTVVNRRVPQLEGDPVPGWFHDCGLDPHMTCVSMGNPHLVLYCQNVSLAPLESVGPVLEHAPQFPRRINVHFVEVRGRGEVTMRTWERGSGITLACGTGACAVCVAGVLTGRTDRTLVAHLPGGDLHLEWSEKDNHVYMTGPAVEVFSGDYSLPIATRAS
ncbi:MAG: diaminopimelate epimerase [Planctomycetales bacterium]